MPVRVLVALALAAVLAPPSLAEPGEAVLIEGVKGVVGPECGALAITRALNAGLDANLPDHDLEGFSGIAFLATVCQNNCLCRDYREATVRLQDAVRALGYEITHLNPKTMTKEEIWGLVRGSLDRGVPAVVFNLFGMGEDVPLVGIDEAKDLAWGMKPGAGDEPRSTSLSNWRSQEIWGYVVGPGSGKPVDRRKLERERLLEVVAAAFRPRLDGG
jgi:hypothetical protein